MTSPHFELNPVLPEQCLDLFPGLHDAGATAVLLQERYPVQLRQANARAPRTLDLEPKGKYRFGAEIARNVGRAALGGAKPEAAAIALGDALDSSEYSGTVEFKQSPDLAQNVLLLYLGLVDAAGGFGEFHMTILSCAASAAIRRSAIAAYSGLSSMPRKRRL